MMLLAYVVPTLFMMGLNVASFSRIIQATHHGGDHLGGRRGHRGDVEGQVGGGDRERRRLERAMQDVVDQRRFVQSIFDSVDVGSSPSTPRAPTTR